MKFMHLSDLHIGKRVNEFSMTEDQRYILGRILKAADQVRPDGVLLAGDIYDKPVPSAEAVQIFDGFLTSLADRGIPVFAISGNHDSAERLAFGASLMSSRGVHFSPVYDGTVKRVGLTDEFGQVWIYLLPFLKPAMVRHALGDEEAGTYDQAVRRALLDAKPDPLARNILVAHQFVTGAAQCESEEISAGGIDQVSLEAFAGFDYVALGHLHSPQSAGRETARYCGTPLKYSFSEAGQEKSVTVVEMLEKENISITQIPLTPLRDMRIIRGTYLEVTSRSFYEGTNVEDYLQVTLTDEEDVPDGLAKLRIIYPNLMRLSYDNQRTKESRMVEGAACIEQKTEPELFEEFYELQNNQPMSKEQGAFVRGLIREIKEKGERE